jgi:hypothetical protein
MTFSVIYGARELLDWYELLDKIFTLYHYKFYVRLIDVCVPHVP